MWGTAPAGSGDQRFFLGYAQIWRGKYREGAMRQQVLSNPHSPAHWRVVGPIRNIDAWYDASNVTPGEKYYLPPDQRVRIWQVKAAAQRPSSTGTV